ncbi:MAG: hypothetical protein K9K38_00265 [Rhodoferax sp.]|nr:hypothetical protein [Rhodoferax sp.]
MNVVPYYLQHTASHVPIALFEVRGPGHRLWRGGVHRVWQCDWRAPWARVHSA